MPVDPNTNPAPAPHISGGQRFFARAMYVFFAKPFLFLIPALAIFAFGIYSSASQPDEFRSIGAVSVSDQTFLQSLNPGNNTDFGYSTPADAISLQFNQLMQTDDFAGSVLTGAGFAAAQQAGLISIADVRQNVYASSAGQTLMRIVAVSDQPQNAKALANSAITTFKQWVIDSEASGTDVAENFYNDQMNAYKVEVDAARQALNDYLAAHPAPPTVTGVRSAEDQAEIARLTDELGRAQDRFDTAVDNREKSRLAKVVSQADIDQRLRVLDEPTAPSVPEAGLRTMATSIVIFAALGVLLSIVAVILATILERSILSAADLDRLGVQTRAVVPLSKRMRVEPRRLAVAAKSDQPMRSAG